MRIPSYIGERSPNLGISIAPISTSGSVEPSSGGGAIGVGSVGGTVVVVVDVVVVVVVEVVVVLVVVDVVVVGRAATVVVVADSANGSSVESRLVRLQAVTASARTHAVTIATGLRMGTIVANAEIDANAGTLRAEVHGFNAAATAAAVRRPWSTHAGTPMPS
jgi:hypothetical protein